MFLKSPFMPDPKIIPFTKKRFTFQVNCEGIVRTITISAETREVAAEKAKSKNPGCEITFLWVHD